VSGLPEPNHFFKNAVCDECPEADISVVAVIVVLLVVMLVVCALFWLHEQRAPKYQRFAGPLRRWVHKAKSFSKAVGFLPKAKLGLAFLQVIAAVDDTYAVGLPDSWYEWTRVFRFLGDLNWADWVLPSECVVGDGAIGLLLLRAIVP
jgi:hypothetical protein